MLGPQAEPEPEPADAGLTNSRLQPSEEELSAVPKMKLKHPQCSCREVLLRKEMLAPVPNMVTLVEDVDFKVEQLRFEDLPGLLDANELFAVVAYTYDSQSGDQRGELFYELNTSLRARSATARKATFALWGGRCTSFCRA